MGVFQYDKNGSGKLNRREVRKLLVDLNDGSPVTEDELDFVFKVADANTDNFISALEMSTLLNCWHNYQHSKNEIDMHFKKYDPKGTDRLNKEQLRWLLSEKSGGFEVADEEIEYYMKQA